MPQVFRFAASDFWWRCAAFFLENAKIQFAAVDIDAGYLYVDHVAQAAELLSSAPTADDVLASMLEGNERFMRGELARPRRTPAEFAPLAEGQNPVAVVVGFADSRVAPELDFDQGARFTTCAVETSSW